MLSGIGPAAHLAEHEIPVIAALPGVGGHLMDHVVVDVALAETSGNSLTFLKPKTLWHRIKCIQAILTYTFTGRGPLTCIVCFSSCRRVVLGLSLTGKFQRLQRGERSSVPPTLNSFHSIRHLCSRIQRTRRLAPVPQTWSSSRRLWDIHGQD
jgi:choline dehydrogenase-like flavoprotein